MAGGDREKNSTGKRTERAQRAIKEVERSWKGHGDGKRVEREKEQTEEHMEGE